MTTSDRAGTVEELLPFWVNGSLDAVEREQVERELAADSSLKQQANVLGQIRETMKRDAPVLGPGELGLARLHRAINRDRQPRRERLFHVMTAVAAALATLLIISLSQNDMQTDLYRPASGGAAGPSITVVFRPGVSIDQVSELLLARGLTIAEGPSALGFYVLQPVDRADMPGALAALAEHGALLEVIEHQE